MGNVSSILDALRIAMKMLLIVGLLPTCLAAVEVAQAQQPQLEDVPRSGLNLGEVPTVTLEPSKASVLQQAIKSRDYKRAETLLTREIDGHPQNAALLSWLGRIYFLDGAYLESSAAMKKAEDLSALDDSDRFTLALSYVIVKHAEQARTELEKLTRSSPRDPRYPYWLGRLDYDAQSFNSAMVHLKKALDIDPGFMKAYDNLGLCQEAVGQLEPAIRTYEQATQLNRKQQVPSPWPPLNLGILLVKLGRLGEAEIALRESLQYDPRFPKAHYQMGLLLEKQGELDLAIRELNLAAQFDPAYPEPHYTLGKIYRKRGNTRMADDEFKSFQKLTLAKKDTPMSAR